MGTLVRCWWGVSNVFSFFSSSHKGIPEVARVNSHLAGLSELLVGWLVGVEVGKVCARKGYKKFIASFPSLVRVAAAAVTHAYGSWRVPNKKSRLHIIPHRRRHYIYMSSAPTSTPTTPTQSNINMSTAILIGCGVAGAGTSLPHPPHGSKC
jgi:hypothetical protein